MKRRRYIASVAGLVGYKYVTLGSEKSSVNVEAQSTSNTFVPSQVTSNNFVVSTPKYKIETKNIASGSSLTANYYIKTRSTTEKVASYEITVDSNTTVLDSLAINISDTGISIQDAEFVRLILQVSYNNQTLDKDSIRLVVPQKEYTEGFEDNTVELSDIGTWKRWSSGKSYISTTSNAIKGDYALLVDSFDNLVTSEFSLVPDQISYSAIYNASVGNPSDIEYQTTFIDGSGNQYFRFEIGSSYIRLNPFYEGYDVYQNRNDGTVYNYDIKIDKSNKTVNVTNSNGRTVSAPFTDDPQDDKFSIEISPRLQDAYDDIKAYYDNITFVYE